jgi:dihydropyrimidinase
MPFGGSYSADDFETGTRAAAIGGTTTIVDFAIQAKGTKMRTRSTPGGRRPKGKACIDYGLHMIVTDLPDAGLEDMDDMVREGVASFKLFMAYPNVLMVDDATIFKALRQTAKNGALICMHAENGSVIDVIVQQALAEGKTAPIYHALTRPTKAEAEAVHRAIAMAEMAGVPIYIVHLSSEDALNQVREARDRGLPAFAETCPQYLLLSIEDNMEGKGWEGAKYVFHAAAAREEEPAQAVGGPAQGQSAGGVDGPLPVLLRRSEGAGQGRLHEDSQRRPRHREPAATAASPRRGPGQFLHQPLRRARLDGAGAHLRHVSEKGRARRGQRRRPGPLGSERGHTISAATHHMRVDYSMFEGFKCAATRAMCIRAASWL